jgi:hypothetical protein
MIDNPTIDLLSPYLPTSDSSLLTPHSSLVTPHSRLLTPNISPLAPLTPDSSDQGGHLVQRLFWHPAYQGDTVP